jgi:hypothetical protein
MQRLREANATPYVEQSDSRRSSAIDERTTGHPGYKTSQTTRKRTEECFGWAKMIGGPCKSRVVGREQLHFQFVLTVSAHNQVRMRDLRGRRMRTVTARGVGVSEIQDYTAISQTFAPPSGHSGNRRSYIDERASERPRAPAAIV